MSKDAMQTVINQLSLVMTIAEDVVKAAKQNDLSPALTEVLIRFHNQQLEMEKALNVFRGQQVQIAQLLNQLTDNSLNIHKQLLDMAYHT